MAAIPIKIKHAGTVYPIEIDPSSNSEDVKLQIFSLTGVEPDKQKVLLKPGLLKDSSDISKVFKSGETYYVQGQPSSKPIAALVAPKEGPKFVEDMTERELAKMEGATPAGLHNLGNTCYMNSAVQVLRSIPELQQELSTHKADSSASGSGMQELSRLGLGGIPSSQDFVTSFQHLVRGMSETQEPFSPIAFLSALRTAFPQFAQKSRTGTGYAQQDAEEAWSQIIQQLRQKLKVTGDGNAAETKAFVDKYMAGSMSSSLNPPAEVGDKEEPVLSTDTFLKLDCHINANVNHLRDGILAAMTEDIEKRSVTLERDAVYTKTTRIARLPKYLTVHFVRFFWKRDVNKKAKIMKKVTFPEELDAVEFCTDDLRKRLIPVRDKVREIRKDEQDVERARKRQKLAHKQEEDRKHDADMANAEAAPIAKLNKQKEKKPEESTGGDMDVYKTDAEYEAERAASIKAAKKELYSAIDQQLGEDTGSNQSGLYELRAVITHQGASADSGHYTSFVKKEPRLVDDPKAPGGKRKEEDGKWWWFNDDKVSEVDAERILALSGGGESASALILLYKAIDLPTKDDLEE